MRLAKRHDKALRGLCRVFYASKVFILTQAYGKARNSGTAMAGRFLE